MLLDIQKKQGFTLVEMMVVIGIFLIVTGVILINVPNFREKTSVDLVAQDIAVTIRSSQVFGVGTKALNEKPVAYGVYLSKDENKNDKFVLFADLSDGGPPDSVYNQDENRCGQIDSECQTIYSLNGFHIKNILIYRGSSIEDSSDINVSFERPRPNPNFCTDDGNSPCPEEDISRVEIIVESLKEKKQKAVAVYANGQIAVKNVLE